MATQSIPSVLLLSVYFLTIFYFTLFGLSFFDSLFKLIDVTLTAILLLYLSIYWLFSFCIDALYPYRDH